MEQLKNIEMLTDKIRFKWMKQYRVISENIVLCVSLRHKGYIEVIVLKGKLLAPSGTRVNKVVYL